MMYCVLMHDVMYSLLMAVVSNWDVNVRERGVEQHNPHTYLTLGDLAPDARCRSWEVTP